jgi:hypothetical protein
MQICLLELVHYDQFTTGSSFEVGIERRPLPGTNGEQF